MIKTESLQFFIAIDVHQYNQLEKENNEFAHVPVDSYYKTHDVNENNVADAYLKVKSFK